MKLFSGHCTEWGLNDGMIEEQVEFELRWQWRRWHDRERAWHVAAGPRAFSKEGETPIIGRT